MREPLIHISKRDGLAFWAGWLIRLAAVLISLVICGLFIFSITKLNPIEVYKTMIQGAFGKSLKFWESWRFWAWARDLSLLLCLGVGLAPAFKMRFWNIGAEGQMLVGGIAAAALMIYMGNSGLPNIWVVILMAAAAMVAGAIWGVIPAVPKALLNTNETLFTLMMNYIAMQLLLFFVPKWEHPAGSNKVGMINQSSAVGWLTKDDTESVAIMLAIVAVLTVAMYIYLRYSKHGYEIAVVGESENTARYAAINVKKVVVRSMTLSGAICGLAGFLAVAGADHTISEDTAGGRGFIAIIVAWLAKFNTFVMVLIAALIAFLDKGAIAIASKYNLSNDVSDVITGIILFFILGSEFFINYRLRFSVAKKRPALNEIKEESK